MLSVLWCLLYIIERQILKITFLLCVFMWVIVYQSMHVESDEKLWELVFTSIM